MTATARWLGQDGAEPARQGDVHVTISRAAGGARDRRRGAQQLAAGCVDLPRQRPGCRRGRSPRLYRSRSSRAADRDKSIDLFFPPYRDESKSTMTLRLIACRRAKLGRAVFPADAAIPASGRRTPEPTRSTAKPGDDLQSLVDRFGSVSLSPGTYRLTRPLVLNRPVALDGLGCGDALVFPGRRATPPGRRPSRFTVATPRSRVSRFDSRARSAGTTTSSMARP